MPLSKNLEFMSRAYQLALRGQGMTLPNPMVGAVVVNKGKIVAEGWHRRCGAPHAEAMALKAAGVKAKGADLYVTLEPCGHVGRTPPCTGVIMDAGIKKVFVGVLDPNPKMNGQSITLLRKAGIFVKVGFLTQELLCLNEAFNAYITRREPWVVAKVAQTLDGKVATPRGESKWITSDAAREFSRHWRSRFNGIMVGVNTVLVDDPCLTQLDNRKVLKKIIIDSRLRIPLKAKLFNETSCENVIVITTSQSPLRKRKALAKRACVWLAPVVGGRVDLHWAFKELAKAEIAAILIEGGPTLIGAALKAGLVDKMQVYIAPKIMGDGLASVQGLKVNRLAQAIKLTDVSVGQLGVDIVVEGYVHRDH